MVRYKLNITKYVFKLQKKSIKQCLNSTKKLIHIVRPPPWAYPNFGFFFYPHAMTYLLLEVITF